MHHGTPDIIQNTHFINSLEATFETVDLFLLLVIPVFATMWVYTTKI